jgi:hypothetical protein
LQCTIEHLLLVREQGTMFSFCEIAQSERPNGYAYEAQNVDADRLHHAAYLAILAFVENNFEPTVFRSRT